jgi:hypothetical protein
MRTKGELWAIRPSARRGKRLEWQAGPDSGKGQGFGSFEQAISHALRELRGRDCEIRVYDGGGELSQAIWIDNRAFFPQSASFADGCGRD